MELTIERADVWVAPIDDVAGGLAKILSGLSEAGADLQFIIARRSPEKPGTGVVFVTPLGAAQKAAAEALGFRTSTSIHSVRVEGADAPGLGAVLTAKIAAAGISLRGMSAAVVNGRFVMYLGLDSAGDADAAVATLKA